VIVNNGPPLPPPPPPNVHVMHSHARSSATVPLLIDLTDEKKQNDNQSTREESPMFVPWSDEDVPHRYKCPISLEIMRDAVLCSDGFYYDREHIRDWLTTSNRSPMTNLRIENPILVSDDVLRLEITQWIAKQWRKFNRQYHDGHANSSQDDDDEEEEEEGQEGSNYEDEDEEDDDEEEDEDEDDDDDDEEELDEDVIMVRQHTKSKTQYPQRRLHNGKANCKKKI